MEQDLKEQTSGYHSHYLRLFADYSRKSPRLVYCLAWAQTPCSLPQEFIAQAKEKDGEIIAVYDGGINLAHYGEVDQLAPAGAMAEFVDYVRTQSQEEAEQAFSELFAKAKEQEVNVTLCIVFGHKGLETFCLEQQITT